MLYCNNTKPNKQHLTHVLQNLQFRVHVLKKKKPILKAQTNDLKYNNIEPLLHSELGMEHKNIEGGVYTVYW